MKFLDINGVETLWDASKNTFVPQNSLVITGVPIDISHNTEAMCYTISNTNGQFAIVRNNAGNAYELAFSPASSSKYYSLDCLKQLNWGSNLQVAILFPWYEVTNSLMPPCGVIYKGANGIYYVHNKSVSSVGLALTDCATFQEAYQLLMKSIYSGVDTAITDDWLNGNLA